MTAAEAGLSSHLPQTRASAKQAADGCSQAERPAVPSGHDRGCHQQDDDWQDADDRRLYRSDAEDDSEAERNSHPTTRR